MLARARAAGRPLMVRFHAEWCLPCRTLEGQTLSHPTVRKALDPFLHLAVDTDESPEAATWYEVDALPTLLILDVNGTERARFEGLIETERLAERLNAVAREIQGRPTIRSGEAAQPILIVPIVLLPTDPGG